jgi:hypothetical protein
VKSPNKFITRAIKVKKISNNRHPTHTQGIGIKLQLNIQLPKGMEIIIEQLLLILENN